MLLGFVLTLITTLILTGTAVLANAGATVSIWWQILAFLVLTYSELCISMIGLQFAYDQALPGTKSTVTAFFFLTIFIGDLLGGYYSSYYENPLTPTNFFAIQIGLMAACTVLFWMVARKFERGSPPQELPAGAASA
jgi:POT family proton-dependent oligopeptide transporter